MIGLSVCSGIGAPEVAAPWIDWRWQSEIERFPSAVLAHHYPDAVNLGDMTKFAEWPDATVDVLVGGTPCQSFSVAGLRRGLADPRGNLALTYLALADRYRPRWLVWENVPGVLSSNGGRDFGAFLGGLGQLGYGWAYAVLDARWFGVAQRRRRVFVVGHSGGWAGPAAVLLEPESLRGDTAPRREAGQGVAPTLAARTRGGGGLGTDFDCDGGLTVSHDPVWPADVAPTMNAAFADKMGLEDQHALNGAGMFVPVAHSLRGEGFDASEDGTGRGTPLVPMAFAENQRGEVRTSNIAPQLTAGGGKPGQGYPAVAFDPNQITSRANRSQPTPELLHTLPATAAPPHLFQPAVRRLTPTECERLQGFSDGYTAIPYRGRPADQCPDGPRYKALGNSMAVPVVRWIFDRIRTVDAMARDADEPSLICRGPVGGTAGPREIPECASVIRAKSSLGSGQLPGRASPARSGVFEGW